MIISKNELITQILNMSVTKGLDFGEQGGKKLVIQPWIGWKGTAATGQNIFRALDNLKEKIREILKTLDCVALEFIHSKLRRESFTVLT